MSQLRILDHNYVFDPSVVISGYSSQDSEFPTTNLRKHSPAKVWRTTGITSQNVTFDLLALDPGIDSVAIVFDPTDGCKFTDSAVVKVQASVDNFSTTSVDVTLAFDSEFGVFTHFFTSAQNYRYWRFTFTDSTNPNTYLEIGKLILSASTKLSQMPEQGFKWSEKDGTEIQRNEYGVEFFDVYPSQRFGSFQFRLLPEADKNLLRDIFRRCGKVTPIAIALDPLQAFLSNKDEHFIYCRLNNDFDAKQAFSTFFDIDLEVREAL